jgi:hypothetical protein
VRLPNPGTFICATRPFRSFQGGADVEVNTVGNKQKMNTVEQQLR